MKEHPILFSTPMVNAILDGRKTMTRRVFKGLPELSPGFEWNIWPAINGEWEVGAVNSGTGEGALLGYFSCKYGIVGDRLWVRETFVWNPDLSNPDDYKSPEHCFYRADGEIGDQLEDPDGFPGWKPSIFMPRWASRIDLEITGIRVERLQEISEQGAREEGIYHDACGWFIPGNARTGSPTARECFSQLWDSINGKKFPWSSNPWVWVIEFKRMGR